MLTQDRLKELLHYFPVEGIFVRRVSRGSRRAGSIAGGPHVEGYIRIGVDYEDYLAHRLAFLYMEGWMPVEVDHENHIRDDNRWENLRAATSAVNGRNSSRRTDSISGFTGVNWDKRRNKWRVRIYVDGREIYLGLYDVLEDAVAARKAADIKYGFHPNHGAPL